MPGCDCWWGVAAGLRTRRALGKVSLGELVIDEGTYTARLRGRPLDLTYKEFELLKYLAQHAGRVFTRAQLLQEVWGYDFFGGTRTVDVHVRRLRAKLGPGVRVADRHRAQRRLQGRAARAWQAAGAGFRTSRRPRRSRRLRLGARRHTGVVQRPVAQSVTSADGVGEATPASRSAGSRRSRTSINTGSGT